jgi:hypothetical protein
MSLLSAHCSYIHHDNNRAFLQERNTFDAGEIEAHSLVYNTFCWVRCLIHCTSFLSIVMYDVLNTQGVSLVLALLPLSTGSYGRNQVGRTIDDDGEENDANHHHNASCWLLTDDTSSFVWRIVQVFTS